MPGESLSFQVTLTVRTRGSPSGIWGPIHPDEFGMLKELKSPIRREKVGTRSGETTSFSIQQIRSPKRCLV